MTDEHAAAKKTQASRTGKRYSSVADLLEGMHAAQPVIDEVARLERQSQIVGVLISLRQEARLTQQQMAEKIGVSQSAISKLESMKDEDLTFEHVRKYSEAAGQPLLIEVGKPMNHMEAVQFHASAIKDHLTALAENARLDGGLKQEIQAFFGEAFFNILGILSKCQEQIVSEAAAIRITKVGSSPASLEKIAA